MTDEAIIDLINKTLSENFNLDQDTLTPESLISEDLGLDSFDAVDLIILLEVAFKRTQHNNEIPPDVKRLKDLYAYIIKVYNEERAERNITRIFEQITTTPVTTKKDKE